MPTKFNDNPFIQITSRIVCVQRGTETRQFLRSVALLRRKPFRNFSWTRK